MRSSRPLAPAGWGEVYRARDTKLGPDVAIKVLAENFVADPEACWPLPARGTDLATLNHPHIATIYGLEEGAAASSW